MKPIISIIRAKRRRKPRVHRRLSERGYSLVEMVISVSLFTIVGVFVASLFWMVAAQCKRSLIGLPAADKTQYMMNFMRFKLQQARYGVPGSAIGPVISNSGQRIQYIDPFVANGHASAIYKDGDYLKYKKDITLGETADNVWKLGRVKTIQFSMLNANTTVDIVLSVPAPYHNGKVWTQLPVSAHDRVFIRN